jgi:hypothetical protein
LIGNSKPLIVFEIKTLGLIPMAIRQVELDVLNTFITTFGAAIDKLKPLTMGCA